jgi:hypothetical protein
MATNRDTILLETVRTHRARLLSAFLYGELTERRLANDNLKRLIGSIVLAAVVCTGCVGFSLVTSIMARQAAARAAAENKGPVVPGISDQPFAADYFDRSVDRGWGRDDTDHRWQTGSRTADFSVSDGAGVIKMPAGSGRLAYLDLARENADVSTTVRVSELGATVAVVSRKVGQDDYRVAVSLAEDRAVSVALLARQDGELVPLANTVGLLERYSAGDELRIRMQAYGVRPTVLRAKVWPDGEEEPQAWTVVGQDDYETLQRGGAIGVGAEQSADADALRLSVAEFVARPVFA